MFALPNSQWVLKGGTGLAIRMPAARHSRDLDLSHQSQNELADAVAELVQAGRASGRDPFVFDIRVKHSLTGVARGQTLAVTARLGQTTYQQFPIDMTTGITLVGNIDVQHHPLPVQIEDVAEPPPMRLYPLADQTADKVAAMYETHGDNRPSSRYRDLVDLILITKHHALDRKLLAVALRNQAAIRTLDLPATLRVPGPDWESGYERSAAHAAFASHERKLKWALQNVGIQIEPALDLALR